MIRHKNRKSKYKRRNQKSKKTKISRKTNKTKNNTKNKTKKQFTKQSILQYGGEERVSDQSPEILKREKKKAFLNMIRKEALRRQALRRQAQLQIQGPVPIIQQAPPMPQISTIQQRQNNAKLQKLQQ